MSGQGKLTPSESFSEWFDWIIREAEVYDYGRYPLKGTGIWLPYGFKIRENVLNLMRKLLNETGHEEILLPVLIPYDIFIKESEHIRGFEDQVYWVTHGGLDELDVKLALRPTSETALTFMESFWIKSYRQLPKKYYQVVSIFRYETKATRAMIRVREVTTFKEAHTVHEDFEDSERQVKEAIGIYSKFFNELGIPYVISKRPDWDKFAGAIYSIAFDTLMPDGKALQIGTVHNLGQNFTKVFEVRIQRRDESLDYAWQTSYGISERVIASLIAIHGDEKGLVLPFFIAPIQIVIVPIPGKNEEEYRKVLKRARELRDNLEKAGLRVALDDREEETPGSKFYYWERRGVPLRIEVGPKELREGTVTVANRLTGRRVKVPWEDLAGELRKLGESLDRDLRERAWSKFRSKVKLVKDIESARKVIRSEGGIAQIPWCGSEECALKMEELLEASALGTPLDELGKSGHEVSKCPICGKDAVALMRYSRKY